MTNQLHQKPLLNLLIILLLVVLPHYWPFPFFSYAPVCTFIIIWVLRSQKESLAGIGFRFTDFSWKSILVGILLAFGWVSIYHFMIQPLLTGAFHLKDADVSAFNFIRRHVFNYIFVLIIAFLVGGWYEEIVFRGFILRKIMAFFPGNKYNFLIATFISTLLFGLYHIQQGIGGVVHATLFGFIACAILYRFKGNMWYGMFFHAFYDVIGLSIIFLDIKV